MNKIDKILALTELIFWLGRIQTINKSIYNLLWRMNKQGLRDKGVLRDRDNFHAESSGKAFLLR